VTRRLLLLVSLAMAAMLSGCTSSSPAGADRVAASSTAAATASAASTAPATAAPTTEVTLPDAFTNPPRPEDPTVRAAFAAAKATWVAAGLRDYAFRVRFSCFCPMYGPWDVVVRNGAVVSSTPLDAAQQVGLLESFRTVDDLVAQVDRAVAHAGSLDVVYDPLLGYPASVRIDWITRAIDDENSWVITSLMSGPTPPTSAAASGAWPAGAVHVPTAADIAARRAAQDRWEAAALRSYGFRVVYRCTCGRVGHWDVRFDDGVVSAAAVDPAEPPGLPSPPELVDVAAMFRQLELSLLSIDELAVQYDAISGYPVRAVSRSVGSSGVDETSWEITSFVAA
jgi:Family of unknown function (DUF6174)